MGPRPESFLPLHPLELRILLAVIERPSHGYRIVKEIEEHADDGTTIYPANLYRRIRDLLGRELLEESEAPPDEGDVDPRRTYFEATELGRAVARAERARLRELVRDADRALGTA
ncbi:MAG: helix-turn-helix transcriptional regulator [Gemmatimonadota bacterium]